MTPNEYQRLALAKEADQEQLREWCYSQGVNATRLTNACRGLADDCGELNGAAKRWLEYQQPLDRTNVIEEIGDCLWRLAQACAAVDTTLESVMEANLRKLGQVRYKNTRCNPRDAAESNRDRDAERLAIESTDPTTPLAYSLFATAEDDGVCYEELDDYASSSERRTADEWCEFFETIVMDPDGWRNRGMSFSDRITYREFAQLWLESTCRYPPSKNLLKVIRSLNNNYNPESNPVETRPCCPECKTPYSDRAPVFCPECGVAQQPITKG